MIVRDLKMSRSMLSYSFCVLSISYRRKFAYKKRALFNHKSKGSGKGTTYLLPGACLPCGIFLYVGCSTV